MFSEYFLAVIGANIYIVVVCPSEVRDRATGLYCTVVCPFKRGQRQGQTSLPGSMVRETGGKR